jgi:hypothetical protein
MGDPLGACLAAVKVKGSPQRTQRFTGEGTAEEKYEQFD